MLPWERERLMEQLISWGYSPRMVEKMQPWSLLSHYESEKKKRSIKDAQILTPDGVKVVDKIDGDKKKYKGTTVPYRLK